MAILYTTGDLCTATNSTASQISLYGNAHWIYVSAQSKTFGFFSQGTASTGTGENLGLNFASGEVYVFQTQPGEAKYWYHCSTTPLTFTITEVC